MLCRRGYRGRGGGSGPRRRSEDGGFEDVIRAIGVRIFVVGMRVFESEAFGLWEKRESETIGIEAIHELPGIDNLRLGARRFGLTQRTREHGAEREPRRGGRLNRNRRRIEIEEAISGGGERDNVVTQSRASELGEFVVVIQKMGRNTTHFGKLKINGN